MDGGSGGEVPAAVAVGRRGRDARGRTGCWELYISSMALRDLGLGAPRPPRATEEREETVESVLAVEACLVWS